MIDVMMILTIFLAVMAFLPQVRTSITAHLPEASSAQQTPPSKTVELTKDGLKYEGQPTTPDQLTTDVQQAIAKNPETSFVIAADKSLTYQQVMDLLDRVKSAGAQHIGLAANKP